MRITLGRVFLLSAVGVFVIFLAVFGLVYRASQRTLLASSDRIRGLYGNQISDAVASYLRRGPESILQFQAEIEQKLVDPADLTSIERELRAILLRDPRVTEASWTYAVSAGYDSDGVLLLRPERRGQTALFRSPESAGELTLRKVTEADGGFVSEDRRLGTGELKRAAASDPTEHSTFRTTSLLRFRGQTISTDLHRSQLIDGANGWIEVSSQRAIADYHGEFAGVLRVGMSAAELDSAVRIRGPGRGGEDPHRAFLCDAQGRLVTRVAPGDVLAEMDDDEIRVVSKGLPAQIATALSRLARRAGSDSQTERFTDDFTAGGSEYLATFTSLAGTQDWLVGIVVPRAYYLKHLASIRSRLLIAMIGITFISVCAGLFVLRIVRQSQLRIISESARMNAFDFTPTPIVSRFEDVRQILSSLECAKTAMRAMGKYVPLELVKRLYRERREPVLGGEATEISILFTDIADFTHFAEVLRPMQLADALGRYLDVMAAVIQGETMGTIDKFIGDAIMAIWNVPEPLPDHPARACAAALRCRDAAAALCASDQWSGLPTFKTRFGLHVGEALVGHFGAHNRMDYTAIGDTVNLASRLESLNKNYGTEIIVSEAMKERVGDGFLFRLLDVVAVKGKRESSAIYELIAAASADAKLPPAVLTYEKAFAAYRSRDFPAAIALLEQNDSDPPSRFLAQRCRDLLDSPPPAEWNGVRSFTEK